MEIVELRTERLLLRAWRDDDLAPFAAMNADPRVMEHFPALLERDASDAMAGRIRDHFTRTGFGLWAVEVPGEIPFAGFVGMIHVPFDATFTPAIEIGWRLAHAAWNRGFATEAAREVMRHAFESLALRDLVSMTVKGNRRSWHVMEKLGMTRREDEDFDHPRIPEGSPLKRHVLYRIDRARWDALRRQG